MRSIVKIAFLMFMFLSTTVCYATDIFQIKKSDSNIKPLVFPLSMVVVENRPAKGFYFPIDTNAPPISENSGLNLSDKKQIHKTLGATDPVRITPYRVGETVYSELNKDDLVKHSNNNPERIIFIFRRELNISGDRKIDSGKMKAGSLISKGSPFHLKIRTRGLLYLTRQKKILFLQPNVKEKDVKDEDIENQIQNINRLGLLELANEAKRVLKKNKFEKRRSSY